MPMKQHNPLYNKYASIQILLQQLLVVTPLTNASCTPISLSALEYTAFEMWWHMRRNQILSFGETDESI
jgi:hypothetical protein